MVYFKLRMLVKIECIFWQKKTNKKFWKSRKNKFKIFLDFLHLEKSTFLHKSCVSTAILLKKVASFFEFHKILR